MIYAYISYEYTGYFCTLDKRVRDRHPRMRIILYTELKFFTEQFMQDRLYRGIRTSSIIVLPRTLFREISSIISSPTTSRLIVVPSSAAIAVAAPAHAVAAAAAAAHAAIRPVFAVVAEVGVEIVELTLRILAAEVGPEARPVEVHRGDVRSAEAGRTLETVAERRRALIRPKRQHRAGPEVIRAEIAVRRRPEVGTEATRRRPVRPKARVHARMVRHHVRRHRPIHPRHPRMRLTRHPRVLRHVGMWHQARYRRRHVGIDILHVVMIRQMGHADHVAVYTVAHPARAHRHAVVALVEAVASERAIEFAARAAVGLLVVPAAAGVVALQLVVIVVIVQRLGRQETADIAEILVRETVAQVVLVARAGSTGTRYVEPEILVSATAASRWITVKAAPPVILILTAVERIALRAERIRLAKPESQVGVTGLRVFRNHAAEDRLMHLGYAVAGPAITPADQLIELALAAAIQRFQQLRVLGEFRAGQRWRQIYVGHFRIIDLAVILQILLGLVYVIRWTYHVP